MLNVNFRDELQKNTLLGLIYRLSRDERCMRCYTALSAQGLDCELEPHDALILTAILKGAIREVEEIKYIAGRIHIRFDVKEPCKLRVLERELVSEIQYELTSLNKLIDK